MHVSALEHFPQATEKGTDNESHLLVNVLKYLYTNKCYVMKIWNGYGYKNVARMLFY